MADASALVDYILQTGRAAAVSDVVRAKGVSLVVPAVCDIEFASAIRRGLRTGEIGMGRAEEAVGDYLDLALQRYGHTALLPKILDLRENLSAYDACYVALAQQLNAQLLTTDRRLARAVAADPRLRVVLAGHA